MIGNDAFQEADIVGISRSVTKHNYLVSDRKDLGRILREAFYIASTGGRGPSGGPSQDVLMESSADPLPQSVSIAATIRLQGHSMQIKKAAHVWQKPKSPVLHRGRIDHLQRGRDLRKVVDKTDVPVVTSSWASAYCPAGIPACRHARNARDLRANTAIQNCDLIFAVGTRFDDRATGDLKKFAPNARVVHVDIDPASISRNVAVEVPSSGCPMSWKSSTKPTALIHRDWVKQTEEWKAPNPRGVAVELAASPRSSSKDRRGLPGCHRDHEVGQNQMWTALYYDSRSPHLPHLGRPGHHGIRLSAAIGAQLGIRASASLTSPETAPFR